MACLIVAIATLALAIYLGGWVGFILWFLFGVLAHLIGVLLALYAVGRQLEKYEENLQPA